MCKAVQCVLRSAVYSVAIVWLGSLLVRDMYLINVNCLHMCQNMPLGHASCRARDI